MPYIAQEDRNQLDPFIAKLHKTLVNMELDDDNADLDTNLQYIFLKLLKLSYDSSPKDLTAANGVLTTTQLAYNSEVVVPALKQREFDTGEISGPNSVQLNVVTVVSNDPQD